MFSPSMARMEVIVFVFVELLFLKFLTVDSSLLTIWFHSSSGAELVLVKPMVPGDEGRFEDELDSSIVVEVPACWGSARFHSIEREGLFVCDPDVLTLLIVECKA